MTRIPERPNDNDPDDRPLLVWGTIIAISFVAAVTAGFAAAAVLQPYGIGAFTVPVSIGAGVVIGYALAWLINRVRWLRRMLLDVLLFFV